MRRRLAFVLFAVGMVAVSCGADTPPPAGGLVPALSAWGGAGLSPEQLSCVVSALPSPLSPVSEGLLRSAPPGLGAVSGEDRAKLSEAFDLCLPPGFVHDRLVGAVVAPAAGVSPDVAECIASGLAVPPGPVSAQLTFVDALTSDSYLDAASGCVGEDEAAVMVSGSLAAAGVPATNVSCVADGLVRALGVRAALGLVFSEPDSEQFAAIAAAERFCATSTTAAG